MSDHPYTEEDEYLVQATLQLLGSKRKNYAMCMSCGAPMRHGHILVCAECLGHQCEVFEKIAELPETNEESEELNEESNKEKNEPQE